MDTTSFGGMTVRGRASSIGTMARASSFSGVLLRSTLKTTISFLAIGSWRRRELLLWRGEKA
jgi:hypothetical protein